jgi:hypothetical protein
MNRVSDSGANQNNTLAALAALAALTTIPNQPAKFWSFAKCSLATSQQSHAKNKLSSSPIITLLQLKKSRTPSLDCLSSKQTMLG